MVMPLRAQSNMAAGRRLRGSQHSTLPSRVPRAKRWCTGLTLHALIPLHQHYKKQLVSFIRLQSSWQISNSTTILKHLFFSFLFFKKPSHHCNLWILMTYIQTNINFYFIIYKMYRGKIFLGVNFCQIINIIEGKCVLLFSPPLRSKLYLPCFRHKWTEESPLL